MNKIANGQVICETLLKKAEADKNIVVLLIVSRPNLRCCGQQEFY